MKYYEDECCGCAVPSYPCMGDACPNRHVPYWKCDECGEEGFNEEEMYNDDYCIDCAIKLGYTEKKGLNS